MNDLKTVTTCLDDLVPPGPRALLLDLAPNYPGLILRTVLDAEAVSRSVIEQLAFEVGPELSEQHVLLAGLISKPFGPGGQLVSDLLPALSMSTMSSRRMRPHGFLSSFLTQRSFMLSFTRLTQHTPR